MNNDSKSVGGDISEILKKISEERSGASTPKNSGEVEFEIGTPVKNETQAEPQATEPKEVPEPQQEAEPEEEEQSVLNIFDLAEKEDTGAVNEGVFRFRTTYIPRFTDVDYGYEKKEAEEKTEQRREEPKAEPSALDPTAELDPEQTPDAISVKTDAEEALIDETATVFKFSDPDDEKNTNVRISEPVAETVVEPPVEAPIQKEPELIKESAAEPIVLEEPLVKKTPERYVPTEVSGVEHIRNVGDVIMDDATKNEFKSIEKRDYFKDKFIDTLLSIKVRLFVALVISLGLLVFENLGTFKIDITALLKLETMPAALAVIDLQFSVCLFLLTLPELVASLKGLVNGRVGAEILVAPAFCVYLIYTVSIIVKEPSKSYVLLGFLFSVFVIASILSALYKKQADFIAFKTVSASDDKQIVDNKPTRTLERENMALDGVIDEYKSETARVFRTSFVADFFHRSSKSAESVKHMLTLLLLPFGVALVVAFIAFFVYGREYLTGVTAFSVVYLFSLPAFSFMVHKLPYYHAAGEADSDGALIGEAALHEYSEIDVICFEDTEIFDAEDVNIQRIMLYGNNENLTKALRQMSALFMNVGGPLDIIFSNSLDKKCDSANGICIKENGVSGEIDGKKVMAGNYEYMLSEGALLPDDEAVGARTVGSTKIMYAAENGVVYAKFYIRYRFSEEFTMLLPSLREEKIIPLVYTRDPNVSEELFKTLTAGKNDIRILKKNTIPNLTFAPSKISSGMVIKGDKESLVNLILLTKRYVKLNQIMKITERSAMGAALTIGALLSLGGMLSTVTLPILALWQIAWCIALYAMSKKTFKLPKKEKEENNNAK